MTQKLKAELGEKKQGVLQPISEISLIPSNERWYVNELEMAVGWLKDLLI